MANDMKRLSGVDIIGKRKGLLVTPELCTGCRGCQVSCKEWNKLPAEKTRNTGTYENPPDLTANTWNKIEFVEKKKGAEWLFISRRCMHCADAGCIKICPVVGALYRTREGAVAFNKRKCIGCKLCSVGCPFDIPRFDENDKVSKCHLCFDRTPAGLAPLCAKTCPTGAIAYGEMDSLKAGAKVMGYDKVYGETALGGLGVLFAFREAPSYYNYENSPGLPGTVALWRNVLKPLTAIGLGASVGAAFVHYLTIGPDEVTEEGGDA
jgi:formate dehydrogenase iron-sulfur subunit